MFCLQQTSKLTHQPRGPGPLNMGKKGFEEKHIRFLDVSQVLFLLATSEGMGASHPRGGSGAKCRRR